MALKAFVNSLDEVPEAARDLYTREGDGYVLAIDDTPFKAKLSEFRNNNIDLTKKLELAAETGEELKALQAQIEQYKDIDPEAAREAMQKMSAIEEKKLIDAGQIEDVVAQRVDKRIERMRAEYEGKLAALQKSYDNATGNEEKYRGRLEEVLIDSELTKAVMNVGKPRAGAMEDILARGRRVWKLDEDGNPTPMNGADIMYGSDGKKPISAEEWAQSLLLDAGYLFEGNAGGGANGNLKGGVQHGMVNLSDQDGLNNNLEAIAAGEVGVSAD